METVTLCRLCSSYALPCCTAECQCGVKLCIACMQDREHVKLLTAEVQDVGGISVNVTFHNPARNPVLTISCTLNSRMHEHAVISLWKETADRKLREEDPRASGFLANTHS